MELGCRRLTRHGLPVVLVTLAGDAQSGETDDCDGSDHDHSGGDEDHRDTAFSESILTSCPYGVLDGSATDTRGD